jgi:hypothetical protein
MKLPSFMMLSSRDEKLSS